LEKELLSGIEGVFIPVSDPHLSAKWYEEKLDFKLVYIEEEAAVMKISERSETVVCLVRTPNHKPMRFPENNFGVGKYYNFMTTDIENTYKLLVEQDVKVNKLGGEGTTRFFTFFDPDGNPLGVCQ
jgi:glyoxylase I family protein